MAAGLWVFGLLTGQDLFPVLLTLPLFALILFQLGRIGDAEFGALDMFWFCILLFFVVAPCQTIADYSFNYWGPTRDVYAVSDFFIAMIIVLTSVGAFALVHSFFSQSQKMKRVHAKNIELALWHAPVLLMLSAVGFVGYVMNSGGLGNVLAARQDKVDENVVFWAFGFLGVQCAATALLAIIASNPKRDMSLAQMLVSWGLLAAASSMLLISINPFNSPRFFVLGCWVPVFFSFWGSRLRYWMVYAGLLAGILVVMPLMSISTRGGMNAIGNFQNTNYAQQLLLVKDVDVFDTLVHCVGMVREQGYMLGDNTLAIVLFFVPRSIWIGKPVVGGLIVGEDLLKRYGSAGTSNLSFYPAGDLYMDFGLIGVLGGACLVAFLWGIYSRNMATFSGRNLATYMLIGSLPIMLRGPLGAVVGFFFCLFWAQILIRITFSIVDAPFEKNTRARGI